MKKKIFLVLSIVAVLCLFAISVSAVEVDGVHYSLNAIKLEATVSTGNRTAENEIANIPSFITYEGVEYKVTAIATDAFWGNNYVKEIRILSEYITAIPANMIACTRDGALEKIYINFSNITSIGSAGLNPSNQTNGNSPCANNFYYYDAKAFSESGIDVLITDPDLSNCTKIGAAAFQGANFEKLTIPAAVAIDNQMFRMSTIKELVIEGEDRETLSYYTFNSCKQLQKIVIKSRNLKKISNDIFAGCTAVTEIYIDLSKCEDVSSSAFMFSTAYDAGQTRVQWYNLEGEKIVDLSSMKYFRDRSFASSNLGSAKIIWPKAIELLDNQAFRKCNINQPMLINAAPGASLTLMYWAFEGNTPTLVVCNEGVTTISARFNNLTAVFLASSINLTDADGFKKEGTTIYYKSLAEGSRVPGSNCVQVQITNGVISNYGACGFTATVDGTVIGSVAHTTSDAINNSYCPVGKVTETTCKYCDFAAYSIDGVSAEKREHSYDLIGSIVYLDYFQMGYKTTKCQCGDEKASDEATEMPLFVDYGYSVTEKLINGKHSMVQCYMLNKEAYNTYVAFNDGFEFGVVVSLSNDPLNPENSGLIAEKKTYITEQSFIAHDYFDIGIVGIGENQTGAELVFCAYVRDNGKIFYLDDGETKDKATFKSHDALGEVLN